MIADTGCNKMLCRRITDQITTEESLVISEYQMSISAINIS